MEEYAIQSTKETNLFLIGNEGRWYFGYYNLQKNPLHTFICK